MNDLQIFIYSGAQLRTIQQPDGLWWVLRDVCQVLGLDSPHKVAERLDDDEKGRNLIPTPGGKQEMTIINEPGLYSVILRSDKPEAKAFKRWVVHEVLPSIRKTGSYGMNTEALQELAEINRQLEQYRQRYESVDKEVAQARKQLTLARASYDGMCKARSLWLQTIRYQEVRRDDILKSLTDGVVPV